MKYLFLLLLQLNAFIGFAQENIKVVTYGVANSYEKALSISLRNALEQTAGAYISNMTIIENDSLLYDETKSISNGTIVSYDILTHVVDSAYQKHSVTIQCVISPQKFTSFVKSANNAIEFNGNAFIQNIKLNRLYKENEPSIISQFLSQYFTQRDTVLTDNSLYFSDWYKLYDKDVKVIGNDPFIYNYEPLQLDHFRFDNWRNDVFTEKWDQRKDDNFRIAKELIEHNQNNLSQPIVKIGDIEYNNLHAMHFKSNDFDIAGYKLFDSLYILYNEITYYDKMFGKIPDDQGNSPDRKETYKGKSYEYWTDYFYYRLHFQINNLIPQIPFINEKLKAQQGKHVFNLLPTLNPNENYKSFLLDLKKIFKAISVNQDSVFNREVYEKNNGKLFSIYFIDLNSKYEPIEFLVRNEKTYLLFKNVINNINMFSTNCQLLSEELVKTNKGNISTYLFSINYSLREMAKGMFINDHNALVLNPLDQYTTLANVSVDWLGQFGTAIGLRYLFSLSVFMSEKELEELQKFYIANPNSK
jgi:hypothetical protein